MHHTAYTVMGRDSCWCYLYPDNVPVMLLNWARLLLFADRAEISFISIEILFMQLVSFFKHLKSFWDLKLQIKLFSFEIVFSIIICSTLFYEVIKIVKHPITKSRLTSNFEFTLHILWTYQLILKNKIKDWYFNAFLKVSKKLMCGNQKLTR